MEAEAGWSIEGRLEAHAPPQHRLSPQPCPRGVGLWGFGGRGEAEGRKAPGPGGEEGRNEKEAAR